MIRRAPRGRCEAPHRGSVHQGAGAWYYGVGRPRPPVLNVMWITRYPCIQPPPARPAIVTELDRATPHTAARTRSFTESVIRGMTRLATEHDAINLAQGFPNFPCPAVLKEAAAQAIRADINQYAVTWGAKRLRQALARKYADWYGMTVDPE